MRALILNTGSSSLKWSLLDGESERLLGGGDTAWEGRDPTKHGAEIRSVLSGIAPTDVVGHRVVHGGARFTGATLIEGRVREEIEALTELAPLHNPAALAAIDAVSALWPETPQVAAFDTAFHATMPPTASLYPLPRAWNQAWGLRRYGFHGLSISYSLRRSREILGQLPHRAVVCHLGSGCSITSIVDGRSVDTTMGFTPLDGVMMGTRSGAVDPGLLLYLLRKKGVDTEDLEDALNTQSGLRGVADTADFQVLVQRMDEEDEEATLAYGMFLHSLVRAVGAMSLVAGGLDLLVFTGGIGEHSARLRDDLGLALEALGVGLDHRINGEETGDRAISAAGARVTTLVIAAREDLAVLAEVRRVLGA